LSKSIFAFWNFSSGLKGASFCELKSEFNSEVSELLEHPANNKTVITLTNNLLPTSNSVSIQFKAGREFHPYNSVEGRSKTLSASYPYSTENSL
jgi:hypothetical protein